MVSKSAQDAPQGGQREAKSAPRAPKMPQKAPKERQKAPQDRPRAPKMHQKWPRRGKKQRTTKKNRGQQRKTKSNKELVWVFYALQGNALPVPCQERFPRRVSFRSFFCSCFRFFFLTVLGAKRVPERSILEAFWEPKSSQKRF